MEKAFSFYFSISSRRILIFINRSVGNLSENVHSINCRKRIQKLLQGEDYERAVLLMRAARARWTDASEIFGTAESNPEDELMLMKEIFLTDIESICDGGKSGINAIKTFSFQKYKKVRSGENFSLNLIKF